MKADEENFKHIKLTFSECRRTSGFGLPAYFFACHLTTTKTGKIFHRLVLGIMTQANPMYKYNSQSGLAQVTCRSVNVLFVLNFNFQAETAVQVGQV